MSNRNIQISFKVDSNEQMEILNKMIEKGIEPEVDGKPILIWTAENGHTELIKKLKKARKNKGCYHYLTYSNETISKAIYLASKNGHTEIARILIKDRAAKELIPNAKPINTKYYYDFNGYNEIIKGFLSAVENGHTEIVKLYLEAGMNANVKDNEALYLATKNGHTQIVEMLIRTVIKQYESRKKDVLKNRRYDILNENERKFFDEVFYLAVNNGHTKIVKLLLELQRSLYEDYKAKSLNDLLVNLATSKVHTQIVYELVYEGINIDSGYVREALRIAIQNGHVEIEKILKNAGVKDLI